MNPAGWIPPEFREFVYADELDNDDMAAIRLTMRIAQPPDFEIRPVTDEEIGESGVRRLRGVIDTRDGSYHPNRYFKD